MHSAKSRVHFLGTPAIIGGKQDQGVVQPPGPFKAGNDPANAAIHRLHLRGINRHAQCLPFPVFHFLPGRHAALPCTKRPPRLQQPDFDLALINLGITLLEDGRPREALDCFLDYREKFFSRIPEGEKQRIERLIAEARAKL